MKLTEAKLKKLINEVLEEGMNTATMLPDDVYVLIMRRSTGLYVVAFANDEADAIVVAKSHFDLR